MAEVVPSDSDMICEAHPYLRWPHDDCSGPGMPWQNGLNWGRRLHEALQKILEGRGRYSRDRLTHAENTIEDMLALARAALLPPPEKQTE